MRSILFFVSLLSRFVSLVVRIVSAIVNPIGYKPVLAMIRSVSAQVIGVKYIFDKQPCSATGGTA